VFPNDANDPAQAMAVAVLIVIACILLSYVGERRLPQWRRAMSGIVGVFSAGTGRLSMQR